jgi:hypothetical protein
MINGQSVDRDDYIIDEDGAAMTITAHEGGLDIFAFSTPAQPGYATYAKRFAH